MKQDKIVAVRFYAPWCKSCARAAPSFYRVARELEDTVKFVDVPVTKGHVQDSSRVADSCHSILPHLSF